MYLDRSTKPELPVLSDRLPDLSLEVDSFCVYPKPRETTFNPPHFFPVQEIALVFGVCPQKPEQPLASVPSPG